MTGNGTRRTFIGASVTAALAVALGFAALQASGSAASKPQPPFSRGSDEEYARLIGSSRSRNETFLSAFNTQGRDPRALRRVTVATTYAPGPLTLRDAVGAADVVVRGRVISVAFRANVYGGIGETVSTVEISETMKGGATSRVTVAQLGGPMASEDGNGILAQTDTDEILLPGDDLILLLRKSASVHLTTVPGAGILFVRAGLVQPEASNRFGGAVRGQPAIELLATLRGLV